MTKSIFIFTILVVFAAIAVWFFVQKTKEVNRPAAEIDLGIEPQEQVPTGTDFNEETTSAPGQPISYDNGLIVQDIVVGNGKTAENGDTLSAHYAGTLENGTMFDNSYDRGQPLQFVLGAGQLIKGWELGLVGMKEGGKRKLIIPPDLGYGAKGAGNIIPPNATLLFEIELVGIIKK